MTKTAKLLEQARADLAAANQVLADLDAARADAIKTSATFAKWRAAHDEADLECERRALLVETLAADLEREKADAARSAIASRKTDLHKQTVALAKRITEEGAKAAAVLVQLAEQARENADLVEALNRELPNAEQLMTADHMARHRDPAPRENLEESIIDLWTFESTGELVGDQDAVLEHAYDRGTLPGSRRGISVVRRRFRQIRYLAPEYREHADPLASVLRLPRFDGGGLLYDRGQVLEPAPRRELLELIPDDTAPAIPAHEAA